MKKILFVMMMFIWGSIVFAQHSAGDIVLGAELGGGFNLLGDSDAISSYPYDFYDLSGGVPDNEVTVSPIYGFKYLGGFNADYYILNWLSVSSGLFYNGTYHTFNYYYSMPHSNPKSDITLAYSFHRGYLRLPLAVHANVFFLYIGLGFAYNIQIVDSATYSIEGKEAFKISKKGILDYSSGGFADVFFDFGIDSMERKKKNSGTRMLVRVSQALSVSTPKDKYSTLFLQDQKALDLSLILQISGTAASLPIIKRTEE